MDWREFVDKLDAVVAAGSAIWLANGRTHRVWSPRLITEVFPSSCTTEHNYFSYLGNLPQLKKHQQLTARDRAIRQEERGHMMRRSCSSASVLARAKSLEKRGKGFLRAADD